MPTEKRETIADFIGACRIVQKSEFKGKSILIDMNNLLYAGCIGVRKTTGTDFTTTSGKRISVGKILTQAVTAAVNSHIVPICVFDGSADKTKDDTIEERRNIRQKAADKCDQIGDETSDEWHKNYRKSFKLHPSELNEGKNLLDKMGMPYNNSLGDAEAQCAAIAKAYPKTCAGVLTEDYDALRFGSPYVFKKNPNDSHTLIQISLKDSIYNLQLRANHIRNDHNMSHITFTYENFVDFSIIAAPKLVSPILHNDGTRLSLSEYFTIFVINDCNVEKMIEYCQFKMGYTRENPEIPQEEIEHVFSSDYSTMSDMTTYEYQVPEAYVQKWKVSHDYYLNVTIKHPKSEEIQQLMQLKPIQYIQLYSVLSDVYNYTIDEIDVIIRDLDKIHSTMSKVNSMKSNSDFSSFVSYQLKHNDAKYSSQRSQICKYARNQWEIHTENLLAIKSGKMSMTAARSLEIAEKNVINFAKELIDAFNAEMHNNSRPQCKDTREHFNNRSEKHWRLPKEKDQQPRQKLPISHTVTMGSSPTRMTNMWDVLVERE
jgi:hypothetical protein